MSPKKVPAPGAAADPAPDPETHSDDENDDRTDTSDVDLEELFTQLEEARTRLATVDEELARSRQAATASRDPRSQNPPNSPAKYQNSVTS